MSTSRSPRDDYSDAALSVYRMLTPTQLADSWRGELYAVQVNRPDGGLTWLAAIEDEASAHGRWFGWDRVAAIVPPGSKER